VDTTKRNICILLSICKCKVYRYSSRSTVFSLLFPSKLLSFLYLHMYEVVGRPATLSCESPLPCHTHQHLIGRIHGAIVAAVGRGDRRPVYTPYKSMFLRVKYSGPAVAVYVYVRVDRMTRCRIMAIRNWSSILTLLTLVSYAPLRYVIGA